jgi:hypothetical protein
MTRLKKPARTDEVKALRKKNAELLAIIDEQNESAAEQRRAKFTIPKGRQMASPRGTFIRVVVPDTHGCYIDKPAFAAMIRDIEQFNVREVVMLGDHVSCDGFLAERHVLTYRAQATYTYQEDVNAGNVFLDKMQATCPKAKFWYICGNHERRVEEWCVKHAKRNAVDTLMLLRALDPVYLLHLKERGIEYLHTHDDTHTKGNTRNTLELGKCLFMHGYGHAKAAIANTLNDMARNVVVGHLHRRGSFTRTTHDSEISAWCPGCLCEKRQFYVHARPPHHAHGYGLQIVKPSGEFLHINVPIIDGKSYLSALKTA